MGLSDYMIAPIQRITRYGLLLKGIVIYTICTVAVLKKVNLLIFFFHHIYRSSQTFESRKC